MFIVCLKNVDYLWGHYLHILIRNSYSTAAQENLHSDSDYLIAFDKGDGHGCHDSYMNGQEEERVREACRIKESPRYT